jgi:hypothetical protein
MEDTRMTAIKGKAIRDEECGWCAYPFDTGDEVLIMDNGGPVAYCSNTCVKKAIEHEQNRKIRF